MFHVTKIESVCNTVILVKIESVCNTVILVKIESVCKTVILVKICLVLFSSIREYVKIEVMCFGNLDLHKQW